MTSRSQTVGCFGLAVCLLVGACSGATPEPSPIAGSNQTPAGPSVDPSTDPITGEPTSSAAAASVDPHCHRDTCPRQVTPTTWVGYHTFAARYISSIGDGRVMTAASTHFQLWDLNDPTWGRSIDLEDAEVPININAIQLLGGSRFSTRPLGDGAPRLAVYDVAAADPLVPVLVVPPGSDEVGVVAALGQDQVVVQIGRPSVAARPLEIWSLETSEVLHQLDVAAQNLATSPSGDVYFTNDNKELWVWKPPAAPTVVSIDIQMPDGNGPAQMRVAASGRVLMARANLASVWDPATNTTVALTGLEPDDDPARFRNVSIDELPDGRIVAAYPDGRIAYWDLANPGAPVIESIGQDLQQMAVLPDGRLLVSSSPANDMDPSEIEVMTPPAT